VQCGGAAVVAVCLDRESEVEHQFDGGGVVAFSRY
jgi:hypothetical protein